MKGLVLSAAVAVAALGTLAAGGADTGSAVSPRSELEVTLTAADGVVLAGTLALPPGAGPHPAALIVSGAGPHDRDGTVAGHAPFAAIADALVARGFAVLRLDDRGVGQSGGDGEKATIPMRVSDARRALEHLAERTDVSSVGLIGHSEGATVAAMVAADDDVAFVISLGGPGVSGKELGPRQVASVLGATGAYPDAIVQALVAAQRHIVEVVDAGGDRTAIDGAVHAGLVTLNELQPEAHRQSAAQIAERAERDGAVVASPWFRSYITTDPADAWRRVGCPILALHGTLDTQVPPGSEIRIGDHRELVGYNHLLQRAETGLTGEYETIDQAIDDRALALITSFAERVTSP